MNGGRGYKMDKCDVYKEIILSMIKIDKLTDGIEKAIKKAEEDINKSNQKIDSIIEFLASQN